MKKNVFVCAVLFLCFTSVLFYSYPGTTEKGRNPVKPGMSNPNKEKELVLLEIRETSPIVYPLDMELISGCLVAEGAFKPLPVGSTLDKERSIFYWLPGPGFIGKYRFLFTSPWGKEELLSVRIFPRFGHGPGVSRITRDFFKVQASNGIPFGNVSTPVDGSTVRSSVPVTGWALDDEGVESVKIYREAGNSLVYIGEAVFVEGARPDVEEAYPGYPNNSAAGWGYMMLTNFLPNGGNGTFTIHAIAADTDGNSVTLGTKTINCDNANAVKPFGAIDTPGQGGTASGINFRSQGWVLTPLPNKVPEDGSTIRVIIDGMAVGNVTYDIFREDIASLFPGYSNSNGALAYFDFDTSAYANGLHTISWIAADDAGNTDGIGSRYFSIKNEGIPLNVACTAAPVSGESPLTVNFTCTVSGGYGEGSYTFEWKFGDGNTSIEQNPTHTYQSGGTYTATVTVKSGVITASCTKTIAVTDPLVADYYVSKNGNDNNDGRSIDTAFKTIGRAFEVVQSGETIQVLAGTYHEDLYPENVGNLSAAITLKGEKDSTILDGQRTMAIGIWCENCKNLVFENLEIRNYTDIGIGVYWSSHITMRNLTVHNNGFAVQLLDWELEGYGIHVDESNNVLIEENDVYQNGPNPQLPDILMGTGINTFECTDCTIRNNQSHENIGGGILVEDGVNVLVEGNNVYNNDLDASIDEWWDGGLWVDGGHDVIIRNNTFIGNLGPGIEISDEDFQKPYGYVLENNVCTGNYYGIFIWNFGTSDWPPDNVIHRSGNQFTGNSRKDIWIADWY